MSNINAYNRGEVLPTSSARSQQMQYGIQKYDHEGDIIIAEKFQEDCINIKEKFTGRDRDNAIYQDSLTDAGFVSVIDDDRDVLLMLKTFLSKKGFSVATFFNGEIALKFMKRLRPSIILMDVFLNSNIDGIEICRRLKASPHTKSIPVIMISGFPKVGDCAINDYGADDFIAKPFQLHDMLQKLYSLLKVKSKY